MACCRFEVDKESRVATLAFDRPEKLHALTRPDAQEVLERLQEAEEDDNVAVVILKGSGRAFGSGWDVVEVRNDRGFDEGSSRPSLRKVFQWDKETLWGGNGLFQRVLDCDKVTIAQVHGYCYGVHLELMTACDYAIASEDARFDHPGWRYLGIEGHLPVYILMLGWRKTKEMMMLPGGLTAAEAKRWGLINQVVPKAELEEETRAIAQRIARNPIDGTVAGKACFRLALDLLGVRAGYTAAAIGHSFLSNLRFEPGEFNLMKQVATKRRQGVYDTRDKRYGGSARQR